MLRRRGLEDEIFFSGQRWCCNQLCIGGKGWSNAEVSFAGCCLDWTPRAERLKLNYVRASLWQQVLPDAVLRWIDNLLCADQSIVTGRDPGARLPVPTTLADRDPLGNTCLQRSWGAIRSTKHCMPLVSRADSSTNLPVWLVCRHQNKEILLYIIAIKLYKVMLTSDRFLIYIHYFSTFIYNFY